MIIKENQKPESKLFEKRPLVTDLELYREKLIEEHNAKKIYFNYSEINK